MVTMIRICESPETLQAERLKVSQLKWVDELGYKWLLIDCMVLRTITYTHKNHTLSMQKLLLLHIISNAYLLVDVGKCILFWILNYSVIFVQKYELKELFLQYSKLLLII